MAVETRAFVEPAVALRSVHANKQHVARAGRDEIGDVKAKRIVAADVAADIKAVQNDAGFTIRGVELDGDAPAGVGSRQLENAAVPANAGGGIRAAQRIKTLAGERRVVGKRQVDGPIVRQIDGLPIVIVEQQCGDGAEVAGLGEVAAEIEVLRRVGGVAQMEAPAEIEQQFLAAPGRGRGVGRGSRSRGLFSADGFNGGGG